MIYSVDQNNGANRRGHKAFKDGFQSVIVIASKSLTWACNCWAYLKSAYILAWKGNNIWNSFTWIRPLHSQLDSRLSYVKQILDNELSTVWQVRRMSYTLSVSLEGSSSYGGFQLVTLHLLLEICSTISTFEWRRALCSQASDLNTTANLSWPRVCLSILASYAGSRTAL